MKIQAVLFDMDGVLIDSEKIILEAAMIGLKQFGVNASPDDFTPFIGGGETRYLGGPAEKYGVKFVPEMKTVVYEIYNDILKQHPESVYPGVLDIVRQVMGKYKAAVCSAADYPKVCHNLNAIGVTPEFFTSLVTGSDVDRQKPFPDIFLKGAENCKADPKLCVAIDDAINGVKAANAAGCVSVGVTTSFTREELINEAGAMYVIDDIREFPALLERIEKEVERQG